MMRTHAGWIVTWPWTGSLKIFSRVGTARPGAAEIEEEEGAGGGGGEGSGAALRSASPAGDAGEAAWVARWDGAGDGAWRADSMADMGRGENMCVNGIKSVFTIRIRFRIYSLALVVVYLPIMFGCIYLHRTVVIRFHVK